jgi:hypothetical protein
MLVLLINRDNLTRISLARTAWHHDFKSLFPNSIFRVGTENLTSSSIPDTPLISPTRPFIPEHKLLFIFHDHLQAFLSETKFRWFIRTTEDVLVHLKRLPLFIRDLESKYNPLRDNVLLGQAVDISPEVTFIHGGSGWIMSRACAEFYVERLAEINRTFISQQHGDDLMPNFFKHMVNLTTEQMTSMAFVGSPMDGKARKRLEIGDYTNLKVCPSLEFQKRALRMTMYLNQTVFWHSGTNDMMTVTDGYRLLTTVPEWLGLGHVYGGVTLCRGDIGSDSANDGSWQ